MLPTGALIAGIWWQDGALFSLPALTMCSLISALLLRMHNTLFMGALFFFSGALLLSAHKVLHSAAAPRDVIGVVSHSSYNPKSDCDELHIGALRGTIASPSNVELSDTIAIRNTQITAPTGDYGRYLNRLGITYTAQLLPANISLVSRPAFSLSRLLKHLSARMQTLFQTNLSHDTTKLAARMFFGEARQDNVLSTQFQYAGVSHLLARSGLHIGLVLLLWQLVFNALPLPWLVRRTLVLLLALSYYALTSASVSFLRALYVFVLYELGGFCGRQALFAHLLCAVCLCMLLVNPYHVFFLDFQLTFALTLALTIAFARNSNAEKEKCNTR